MNNKELELFNRRRCVEENMKREKTIMEMLQDKLNEVYSEHMKTEAIDEIKLEEIIFECSHKVLIYLGTVDISLHSDDNVCYHRYYCPICGSYFDYYQKTDDNVSLWCKRDVIKQFFDALLSGNINEANEIFSQDFNAIREGTHNKGRKTLIGYLEKFGYILLDDNTIVEEV